MEINLLRHATLVIKINEIKLLVDPMLRPARSSDPFQNTPNPKRNPLVELSLGEDDLETLLDTIDGVLVTHTHSDHWDDKARAMLSKSVPLFCQPDDHQHMVNTGFTNVYPITEGFNWKSIRFTRTGGQHGKGKIGRRMAPVSGFILSTAGEPKVYIAGDTIWCKEVDVAIDQHEPDVIIVNAGAAQFNSGGPITMNADDVVKVCESRPSAQVVAIHLEAINHCLLSRSDLEDYLSEAGVKTRVWIPKDGERILLE